MASAILILTIGLPWLGGAAGLAGVGAAHRPEVSGALQQTLAVGFSGLGSADLRCCCLPASVPSQSSRSPFGPYFGDLTFIPDGLGRLPGRGRDRRSAAWR